MPDQAATSGAPAPRAILKLNLHSRQCSETPTQGSPGTPAAPADGGRPRIKLSTRKSLPPTPADGLAPPPPASTSIAPAATTKAGRQTKPTAKMREKHDLDDDDDVPLSKNQPVAKKIRIKAPPKTSQDQRIVWRFKGRPPNRVPGDGYDSEASDREIDPVIEEQIIIRMLPGDHCDYMRKAIEENRLGSKREGGADISLKFFDDESRRAVVYVKGQLFVAVLLDLPTITEGMKTWDRKSFMKSADLSQMLLVFAQVSSEAEAKTIPLPKVVEPGFKWPHGLTPPMHDCVKRRFAKVISRKEIENKEAEVERLLAADRAAQSTRFEWLDDRRQKTPADDFMEDADGEDDISYFPGGAEDMDDLEADLEAAFEEAEQESNASPAFTEGATPMTGNTATPAAHLQQSVEGEEVSDEDEDEDDEDEDLDEEEQARLDEIKDVRVIISNLEQELTDKEDSLAQLMATNRDGKGILIRRLNMSIQTLKGEIQLKKSSIGQADD
jgi:transcription initiation factor TFIID subunit 7